MPLQQDIALWRGNTHPAVDWAIPDGVPLEGCDFFLSIAAAGVALIVKDTASGTLLLDEEARRLRWSCTTAESRRIPPGRIAAYEIERRSGSLEVTEFFGSITGLGGLNADGGPPGVPILDFSSLDNSQLQLLGWI